MNAAWGVSVFPAVPLGRIAEIQLGKMLQPASNDAREFETPYLRAGHLGMLETLDDLPTMFASRADTINYGVIPGDLVVAEGGDVGRAAFAPDVPPGTIIQNSLQRLRSGTADLRFLSYALEAVRNSGWLDVYCNASTFGHLTRQKLAALRVPCPDLQIQRSIADFLDIETARIDALVGMKRRLASALDERLKGEIEWELRDAVSKSGEVRLRFLASEITVGIVVTPAKYYVDEGVPALRGVNVSPGRLSLDELVHITGEGHSLHAKSQLRAGDLVTVRTGQAGATAIVPSSLDGANCIDLLLTRPGPSVSSRFLEYVINSDWCRKHVKKYSVGSIQGHFNVDALKELPIPGITRDEQDRLVSGFNESAARVAHLIQTLDRQIERLMEHRQALLAAAVTGRLDLAKAAA